MKKQKKENTNCKTHLKKNQGITLIALVLTIVILIILAVISMNAIFGEGGIIQSTNDARLSSEQGTVLEDLRMEIYEKMSNPEFGELGGLQYLKEQTGGKLREDSTIDVTKVREGIKSGRGSLDTGDVYYIEGTDLFYLDKEKKAKNLGQIFNDTESLNANLEIKKEVTSTPANGERYAVGEVVKYKITVKNIGTKIVNNIKIEDTLTAIDIVTKEETVRLQQTFDKLYDAEGNNIGNSLAVGQIGYINYTYTVVKDDVGKDLSNIAIVKGKTPIPQGEKPVVTPVELPRTTITLTKKVDYSKLISYFRSGRVMEELKEVEYVFYINFKDKDGNSLPFEVVTPRDTFEWNDIQSQGGLFKLKDGESATIRFENYEPTNVFSLSENFEELYTDEFTDTGVPDFDFTSSFGSPDYKIFPAIDIEGEEYKVNTIASRSFFVAIASPGGEINCTLKDINERFDNSILALNVLRNYVSNGGTAGVSETPIEQYLEGWRSKLFQAVQAVA